MMICDIMNILIIIVVLKSTFNIDSNVHNIYQSLLQLDNVKSLIYTLIWLCGYKIKGDIYYIISNIFIIFVWCFVMVVNVII